MILDKILVWISSLTEAIHQKLSSRKATYWSAFLAGFSLLIFTSCGSQKQVSVITHVARDTLYLNKVQYDSVYIYQSRDVDFIKGIPKPSSLNPPLGRNGRLLEQEPDTVLIREVATEYRYKLLRDTIRIHQVDSIPIIKEVEVTKEIRGTCAEHSRSIPWWSKVLNWIGFAALAALFVQFVIFVFKLKKYIP